jgi:hypothetical protein
LKAIKTKTVAELSSLARKWGLSGYSKLKKSDLVSLLAKGLKGKSVKELIELSKQFSLEGYSKLAKTDLVKQLAKQLKTIAKAPKKDSKKKKTKKSVSKPAGRTVKTKKKPAKKRTEGAKKTKAKKVAKQTVPAVKKRPRASQEAQALPKGYQDGRMVLLPRDPKWLYCYWDPTQAQAKQLEEWGVPSLRIMEIDDDGKSQLTQLIPLTQSARSWYVQIDSPGKKYLAELGLMDEEQVFHIVLTSNSSTTPPGAISKKLETKFESFSTEQSSEPAKMVDTDKTAVERLQALSQGSSVESSQIGIDSGEALKERRWLREEMSSEGLQKNRSPSDS